MAPLSKAQLLQRVNASINICGWQAMASSREHPFRLRATRDGRVEDLIVYIWNTTHGGGEVRPEDEYRIQITGVEPPLILETGSTTLLLGWSEDHGVFSAFDGERHTDFAAGSPSIQTRLRAITDGEENGWGFHEKGNDEVAVSFRPEFFMSYVQNQRLLHEPDAARNAEQLSEAAREEANRPPDEAPVEAPEAEGQWATRLVERTIRDARFPNRVRAAYSEACCMCGVQFGIVEAAHIIPVSQRPNYSTRNGLALCPNHHRAYDAAIVAVAPDFSIGRSGSRIAELRDRGLTDGERWVLGSLQEAIELPPDPLVQPHPRYLERALELRGFEL